MVYCPRCGTKNEDEAKFCVQCGAPLYEKKGPSERIEEVCIGPRERERVEECFGLPHGGVIIGIVFGLLIITWGVLWLLHEMGIIPKIVEIWPFAVIIIGILIITGALYRLRQRKSYPPPST